MSKSNSFNKFFKNINYLINSLLEKNLNKLKFSNLLNLARSNKIFFTLVASIILFLSYLSIPNINNQSEISEVFKKKLMDQYNFEFKFSKKIDYKFLPRPHFQIQDSAIIFDEKQISEIKNIKVYVSLKNLFSLKKMIVYKVHIENANFNLNKTNYNFFLDLLKKYQSESILKISNSNIFYESNDKEVLFINKILNMTYSYDTKELNYFLYSQNEIFNIPYAIKIFEDKDSKKIYSKINIDFLRLQAENEYKVSNNSKNGTINFIFKKLNSIVNYEVRKNYIEFNFFDKLNNPKFSYNGKFNFKPFYSSLQGRTQELNLSYLLDTSAIIAQLIKTEIFNNKNINFKLNIKADKILNADSFKDILITSKIEEGLIDIDDTTFEWKNFVNFRLFNSLIYVKNGELFLDGSSEINLTNQKGVYKFLLTPKKYRKQIKKIELNYSYNFDLKTMRLKDIRINGKLSENINKIINDISIKNDDLQNKVYFKNLLNEALKSYVG